MPDIDIISLPLDKKNDRHKNKHALKKAFTNIFVEALDCAASEVTIRFHEVPGKNYAVDDFLRNEFSFVSNIESGYCGQQLFQMDVRWYAGKSPEVQDNVALQLTNAVTKNFPHFPATAVCVTFQELHYKNTYEGGQRISAGRPSEPSS